MKPAPQARRGKEMRCVVCGDLWAVQIADGLYEIKNLKTELLIELLEGELALQSRCIACKALRRTVVTKRKSTI